MLFVLLLIGWSLVQAPEKLALPGASNVTRVDVAVMCAGATSTDAFPQIRKLGFTAVVNLRREGEPGVDVAAARQAAASSGLKYVHIPVDASNPTTEAVDVFLKTVTDPANHPVYIHCASANRVAAMWLIKRVMVDGWDVARAGDEAAAIGLTHPGLKKFALDYVASHKR
jgi:uncharacterized protein (TIGR01244 family)